MRPARVCGVINYRRTYAVSHPTTSSRNGAVAHRFGSHPPRRSVVGVGRCTIESCRRFHRGRTHKHTDKHRHAIPSSCFHTCSLGSLGSSWQYPPAKSRPLDKMKRVSECSRARVPPAAAASSGIMKNCTSFSPYRIIRRKSDMLILQHCFAVIIQPSVV